MKIFGKLDGCIFVIKTFDTTLQITKSCCRAVLDDRFEVHNDPTCTNLRF